MRVTCVTMPLIVPAFSPRTLKPLSNGRWARRRGFRIFCSFQEKKICSWITTESCCFLFAFYDSPSNKLHLTYRHQQQQINDWLVFFGKYYLIKAENIFQAENNTMVVKRLPTFSSQRQRFIYFYGFYIC